MTQNKTIKQWAANGVVAAIRLYQHTLSPDHGLGRYVIPNAGCRFYPSCSEYAAQAIGRYGLWGGLGRAFKRLGRCHPFTRGGYDPVAS